MVPQRNHGSSNMTGADHRRSYVKCDLGGSPAAKADGGMVVGKGSRTMDALDPEGRQDGGPLDEAIHADGKLSGVRHSACSL